jgi:hypothetical protein
MREPRGIVNRSVEYRNLPRGCLKRVILRAAAPWVKILSLCFSDLIFLLRA